MAHKSSPAHVPENEDHHINLDQVLKWGIPTLLAVLLISMIFLWQRSEGTGLRTEVSQAYTVARSAEELEAIAVSYPDQPEAALALLQAAAERFKSREFDTAQQTYSTFLSDYPGHPLREYAEWGLWMSQEQLGELDSALNGFRSVTDQDLLYPQALLAQARILEKKSSPEEAIAMYETVQETFPDTPWAQQAEIFAGQAALTIAE